MQYNKSAEFKKQQLKKAKIYALLNNKECISIEYVNANTKMKCKCHNSNHQPWLATFNSVVKVGTWCPKCGKYKNIQENRVRVSFE